MSRCRQAEHHQAAAAWLWRVIDTLEGPEYAAFDPSIKVPYDPALAAKLLAASGYSKDKPVKFTIQTTRGFKPKDYEMIQAIVGMWRNVGIDANIEVYEIAKHFELRMTHKLAPAAFYNWGNYIGDPTTSTGFAMWSKSPHSAWHSDDLDAKITPLWSEKDEAKRIRAGRMRTAISPSRAMCCRCCNTRSRFSTSPISRSRTTRPAHCCRRV